MVFPLERVAVYVEQRVLLVPRRDSNAVAYLSGLRH